MFFYVVQLFLKCIKQPLVYSYNLILKLKYSFIKIHGNSISSPTRNMWYTKLQFLDLTLATISTDCLLSFLSACRSLRKISLETLALNSLIFE